MWQARERGNIFTSEILKLSQTLVQLPHTSQPPISICFNYQHITVMAFCCHLLPLFPQLNLTIFCSRSLSSNLEKLRILLHNVEQDAVYVFSQVDVDILLVLQRFPHLKRKVHVKQDSKRKSWFFTHVPSFTSCLSTLDCFMFHSCKLTWRTGFNAIKTRAMQSFLM